ncbi:MAG: hypothetical protein CME06_13750 [Gemmatimonadetes bacterium]|nr:hypothetical protein [Gemmatimonadota bacterium]
MNRFTSSRHLLVLLAALIVCTSPRAAVHTIGNFEVHVDDITGAWEIAQGERTLLATPDAPFLIAERFSISTIHHFGLFDFLRHDKQRFAFDILTSEVGHADTLRLGYASSERSGARCSLIFQQADEGRLRVDVHREGTGSPRGFRLRFERDASDRFLGFGEQFAHVDHTGHRVPIWVSEQGLGRSPDPLLPWVGGPHDSYYPVPMFLDPARGVGFLLECDERSVFDLGVPAEWQIEIWERDTFSFHLVAGPDPLSAIEQLSAVMGRPVLPPDWAFDAWVAVEGGEDRVRQVLDRIDAPDMAVSTLWVQDWVGRQPLPIIQSLRYHWEVDERLYPDLTGLIDDIHERGKRFLGYINGFLVPGNPSYREAAAAGYAVGYPPFGLTPYLQWHSTFAVAFVDFTSPTATTWFQDWVHGMLDHGMDGFMADYGEWLPFDGVLAEGRAPAVHNHYPALFQAACLEVLQERNEADDFVMFSRAGGAWAQGVQQVVWAGDQECAWGDQDGIRTVPRAGISAGIAGVPFWTHDIGGYSGGPRSKELFLRWAELAAFTPIMRTHEGLLRTSNWQWDSDEETEEAFARLTRIHKIVADRVIRPMAAESAATGRPLVRHLALHYPNDDNVLDVEDQYLLGPDLLVAPVLDPESDSRSVYLPAGSWYLVWDRSRWEGSQNHVVPAPIGMPPVFARRPVEEVLGWGWSANADKPR